MTYSNLDYLKDFTDNDSELIKEAVRRYLKKSPVLLEELNEGHKNEDWEKVADTAHNLYSATQIVGVEKVKTSLRDLQHISKNEKNPQEIEELNTYLKEVNEAVNGSFKELNEYVQFN